MLFARKYFVYMSHIHDIPFLRAPLPCHEGGEQNSYAHKDDHLATKWQREIPGGYLHLLCQTVN